MRFRMSLAVAVISTLAMAAPAAAAPPTWEEVTVDDTSYLPRTSAACGFDVFEHDVGELKFQLIASGWFRDRAVAGHERSFHGSGPGSDLHVGRQRPRDDRSRRHGHREPARLHHGHLQQSLPVARGLTGHASPSHTHRTSIDR